MPNIKSVVKDVIKSRKNRIRNAAAKSAMKTYIKRARTLIETGAVEEAAAAVCKSVSIIDKTVERGIMHKNAAARRKSRLMRKANNAAATK